MTAYNPQVTQIAHAENKSIAASPNSNVESFLYFRGNAILFNKTAVIENNDCMLQNFDWNENDGWIEGTCGSALKFDGQNDYILVQTTEYRSG
jgi:hypothetical protein